MKLKHRYLEQVRRNPQSVSMLLKETDGGGKTMVRCWDRAIGRFHKNEEFDDAKNYLESALSNFNDNRANKEKREMLIDKFINYTLEYANLGFRNIKTNTNISINIQHNNTLTGEVFRIDTTNENGLAITLMNRTDDIWASELRFPLLQLYYANIYKYPYDLIKVGVYNFEEEIHEYTSFEEKELNLAAEEVISISKKINQIQL
jgi:hypothetical protein